MAITFPTSLDTLSNPSSGDALNSPSHATQHADANDAIEALQAKVGANSSAVTTSHDYKLGEILTTDKAVGKTATQTLTNKTLTSPVINLGTNATGDMYYRDGSGVFQRLPIGTTLQILNVDASGIPAWVANPSAAPASTTVAGIVELATDAEAESKASTTVALTPSNLGSIFLNESNMASNSATKIPSQASVKAYADNKSALLTQSQSTINTNTADTNENSFLSYEIPANTLGSSRGVRFKMWGTLSSPNSAQTTTIRFKYGATTFKTLTLTSTTGTAGYLFFLEFCIFANSASSQSMRGFFFAPIERTSEGTGAFGFASDINGTATEDSTSAKNLAITTQLSNTTALTMSAVGYSIERL